MARKKEKPLPSLMATETVDLVRVLLGDFIKFLTWLTEDFDQRSEYASRLAAGIENTLQNKIDNSGAFQQELSFVARMLSQKKGSQPRPRRMALLIPPVIDEEDDLAATLLCYQYQAGISYQPYEPLRRTGPLSVKLKKNLSVFQAFSLLSREERFHLYVEVDNWISHKHPVSDQGVLQFDAFYALRTLNKLRSGLPVWQCSQCVDRLAVLAGLKEAA